MQSLQRNDLLWESCEIDVFRDKPLGSGAYGIVCTAKYDRLPCAAKLLHPTFLVPGNWAVDRFMQECSFLASLKHPHVVQFLGVHTERSTGQAVLLMELMDESLTMLLKRHKLSNQLMPAHIQVDICHDVSLALHYLHTKGIIHRDLSSNNILLIGGCRAKITDFGMSKLTLNVSTSLSSLTQVPGCPVYMPPEAWISPPIYTEKLDVFSFGVLTLQIATCRQPNPGPSETVVPSDSSPTGYVKVPIPELDRRNEDMDCLNSEHILRELVFDCLKDKADRRPLASDICETLESIKNSRAYKTTLSVANLKYDVERKGSTSSLIYERRESVPESEKMELLKKELVEKDSKINKLSAEVSKLTFELTSLKSDLLQKQQEIQKLQKIPTEKKGPGVKEGHEPKPTRQSSLDFESICLTGLSPEVLSVISKDPSSNVPNFCVKYHDVSRGEVSFQYFPEFESKEQTIKIFLQFYQHVFNSCNIRVSFVPVPTSFPPALLQDVLNLCGSMREESSFKHIQIVDMVKIVSNTPSKHEENIQTLTNLLNLRVQLDEKRTLTIKHGNIVDEDVSIIVSSANPPLIHRFGVAAAINAASLFEVQNHATALVQKHGIVEVGDIAYTKAGGNLKCEWIIHAIGPSGVYEENVSSKLKDEILMIMKGLLHKILCKAEELHAKSIAMPAISTGNLQLAVSLSMVGILEGIVQHKFNSSSQLSDIRITILQKDTFLKFAEAFIKYKLTANNITPTKQRHTSAQLQSSPISPPLSTKSSSSSHLSNTCKQQ